MISPRHLSWQNFQRTILLPNEQRAHRVMDKPVIEIFGDGLENRIGMWIEVPAGTVLPAGMSRMSALRIKLTERDNTPLLEVFTSLRSLQRQFYYFATAVADRVAAEAATATEAIGLELQCFLDLLEQNQVLGIERQIGLIGELLVLGRLVTDKGHESVDGWIGPTSEPHDFRLGNIELEVKTTTAPSRVHTVHGVDQLAPSLGCSLHLISVLLGPPGSAPGFSLLTLIESISSCFTSDVPRQRRFAELLAASGYRSEDASHYTRQFTLRRPLAVVAINDRLPAITRSILQSAFSTESQRIEYVQYDLNIEGLESEIGPAGFAEILGHCGGAI